MHFGVELEAVIVVGFLADHHGLALAGHPARDALAHFQADFADDGRETRIAGAQHEFMPNLVNHVHLAESVSVMRMAISAVTFSISSMSNAPPVASPTRLSASASPRFSSSSARACAQQNRQIVYLAVTRIQFLLQGKMASGLSF